MSALGGLWVLDLSELRIVTLLSEVLFTALTVPCAMVAAAVVLAKRVARRSRFSDLLPSDAQHLWNDFFSEYTETDWQLLRRVRFRPRTFGVYGAGHLVLAVWAFAALSLVSLGAAGPFAGTYIASSAGGGVAGPDRVGLATAVALATPFVAAQVRKRFPWRQVALARLVPYDPVPGDVTMVFQVRSRDGWRAAQLLKNAGLRLVQDHYNLGSHGDPSLDAQVEATLNSYADRGTDPLTVGQRVLGAGDIPYLLVGRGYR